MKFVLLVQKSFFSWCCNTTAVHGWWGTAVYETIPVTWCTHFKEQQKINWQIKIWFNSHNSIGETVTTSQVFIFVSFKAFLVRQRDWRSTATLREQGRRHLCSMFSEAIDCFLQRWMTSAFLFFCNFQNLSRNGSVHWPCAAIRPGQNRRPNNDWIPPGNVLSGHYWLNVKNKSSVYSDTLHILV